MATKTKRSLAEAVLERYGRTYAEEIGIRLGDTPSALYQLLNAAMLLSARIPAKNAVQAAVALGEAKLTTPKKMAEASWQDRVDVLTWHGYKRYDERTSTMLGDTAGVILDRYNGDLRKLREQANRDVAAEHRLLRQFKGIGPVGADIFLREVQGVWEEAYPYVDARVAKAAGKLGLPQDAKALARLVDRADFPRFVAGLIRVDLAKAYETLDA